MKMQNRANIQFDYYEEVTAGEILHKLFMNCADCKKFEDTEYSQIFWGYLQSLGKDAQRMFEYHIWNITQCFLDFVAKCPNIHISITNDPVYKKQ